MRKYNLFDPVVVGGIEFCVSKQSCDVEALQKYLGKNRGFVEGLLSCMDEAGIISLDKDGGYTFSTKSVGEALKMFYEYYSEHEEREQKGNYDFSLDDPRVRKAIEISLAKDKYSTSLIQGYLSLGHSIVARMSEWLEENGIIGPMDGNKPRKLLVKTMAEVEERLGGTKKEQPLVGLLSGRHAGRADPGDVEQIAKTIYSTFIECGIEVEMNSANIGPQVAEYIICCQIEKEELQNSISMVKECLERKFAKKIRVTILSAEQAGWLGLENPENSLCIIVDIPNERRCICGLRGVLESDEWKAVKNYPLAYAVGRNICGKNVIKDLDSTREMLITGCTHGGKTMFLHSMIASLISHNFPDDLKFIIMDTVAVNYTAYENSPYLAMPVITDIDGILDCVKWLNKEQERRCSLMAEKKVRSVAEYNKRCGGQEKMPYLVVIIDEMAPIMRNHKLGKEFEREVVRFCQHNQTSGIYLALTTQQTDPCVVTELMKANFCTHIAFSMHSAEQSRVAIYQSGAESLTGCGDMLFCEPMSLGYAERIQGFYLSDDDIKKVGNFRGSKE